MEHMSIIRLNFYCSKISSEFFGEKQTATFFAMVASGKGLYAMINSLFNKRTKTKIQSSDFKAICPLRLSVPISQYRWISHNANNGSNSTKSDTVK